MKLNVARSGPPAFTHEGARAANITPYQALRRSVLSCLLWEKGFYETGQDIADRIESLVAQVDAAKIRALVVEARKQHGLRHVPLLMICALFKAGKPEGVADLIEETVTRADELTELVALYWRDGKKPLPAQMKKGLARAFHKFDAYALGKYNRDGAIKLRDVLFMTHAKPKDDAQAALWRALVDGTLESPDTWEVALSGGADKRETFTRLVVEGKIGYLALLRNLRNMEQAGVDTGLVRNAIIARKGAKFVLPFRYVAAARAAPQFEPAIDQALSEAVSEIGILSGRTIVLVDVSGSMDAKLSAKSDLTRVDAAATLASILHGDRRVFTFSHQLVEVPPRHGMAGVDAIIRSQAHGGTELIGAVAHINTMPTDRLIVITDEQAAQDTMFGRLPAPTAKRAYMINVASDKNGIGYGNGWTHIDGFSESVLRYIAEVEAEE